MPCARLSAMVLEYVISVGVYTKDALRLNVKIGSRGRGSPRLGLVESLEYIYQSNDRTPWGIRCDPTMANDL